jgi:2-dehydropantoate 2-reductase
MRILVFGAGAVGSVLGGLLARAGHAVTLLGRARHLEVIREAGLSIAGIWGDHHVTGLNTADSPVALEGDPFDLVFLTVKAYDTQAAIDSIRRIDHPRLALVSVQNGYGNTQALEAAFGRGRSFGARIITGVELVEPGKVHVTVSADDIRLGPPAGEPEMMAQARELATILRDAGIPASATDQYREFLWAKILYNCALNPLGALLHASYGELAEDPGTRQLIDQIIAESFVTAQAADIPLFWKRPDEYRRHFFDKLIPPTAKHYPSMLRDLERRGRTEIEALNGAVVKLADEHGLEVPVNRALTSMIKLREQTRRIELEGQKSVERK